MTRTEDAERPHTPPHAIRCDTRPGERDQWHRPRPQPEDGHAERVERYRKIVEAGGRLFE
jgi:hypothetical protein